MATTRKPKATAVVPPAPPSRRVHLMDASGMAQNRGQWRQTHNPLRGLNSAVLTGYIEESERGATASLQHLIYWIERENAPLIALEERFRSALSELDWTIKIPEHVPPEHRQLAEQQQQKLTEFYHGLRGFRKSIEELGMARFRGVAFLEMAIIRGVPSLDPVPPVYFCRDGFGPWQYNRTAAAGSVNGEALDLTRWVVREADVPICRVAARLHVIRSMCLADWQGYIETFGVPAIFAIMPEGVSPSDRLEFQDIMERIISDARGTLPAGSKLETVTGNNGAGGSPFLELMDWCDKQLVLAGTGGLLTMLAESGSGTLAGGAHMEAFELLARREAVMVSECLQDQMDQLVLNKWFPGLPQYAYFELEGAEENDPDKVVAHAAALKAAGWTMKTPQLAEKTGYEFEGLDNGAGAEAPPVVPPAAPLPALMNTAAPDDLPAPVVPGDGPEVAARKALAGALYEDFEGIRQQLEALVEMDPDGPDFRAALEAAQAAVDQLAGAAPGTLAADRVFEELAAAGLLEGWGLDDAGHSVAPDNKTEKTDET